MPAYTRSLPKQFGLKQIPETILANAATCPHELDRMSEKVRLARSFCGGVDAVDRKKLQRVARERLKDARALLGRKRWAGAYYVSGYAIECGLKACLLKHLGESGAVFGESSYLKRLADCWTHDLVKLMNLAGLDAEFGGACQANPALNTFWGIAKDWTEASRYEDETQELDPRAMFEAVSHKPNGVFVWIQGRW